MKHITVKNLCLQFDDGAYDGSPLEQAQNMITAINEALRRVPDACPQITDTVSEANVEVVDTDGENRAERHKPSNRSSSKATVYKHIVAVTVLSTEDCLDAVVGEGWTLADLHEAIDTGACIGSFSSTGTTPLAGRAVVKKELLAIGNDGSFFGDEFNEGTPQPDEQFQRFPTGVRGRASVLWHRFGTKAARSEGWDLYTRDNGELEIEYIAEPDEGLELRDRGVVDPMFNSDDAVIRHCLTKAREGSGIHQLALYLEGRIHDRECWVPDELLERAGAIPPPT